jgi:predicted dehydrogenase
VHRTTRRGFVKTSLAGGLSFSLPQLMLGGPSRANAAGPNAQVRVAVVGLGGIDVPGSVGGRGRQLISRLRTAKDARIVTLCDVDQAILDQQVAEFKKRQEEVTACRDLRKVLDDKNVDAVFIATPNHWHALATIWACQAGKDVYVEKPFSHNIWEGRQMVAAARKFGRMVQVGTQRRSSDVLPQVFAALRSGQLGATRCAHALVYRARTAMGNVATPPPVPATVDLDLWCGPVAKQPPLRKEFHYDWHWQWPTGNGEIGNNGAHMIDICRWALGHDQPAPRAISIGGRFAFDDNGETPNAQVVLFDYQPAPLLCEIRNVRGKQPAAKDAKKDAKKAAAKDSAMGTFHGADRGIVIECEGGYFAGDFTGGTLFDEQGKTIKEFKSARKAQEIENDHVANFIAAVGSRKAADLHAEAAVGHATATCCHMANISHRLGKQAPPEVIAAAARDSAPLMDALEQYREYLSRNGVDLARTPATLGAWVSLDVKEECFVGELAAAANALSRRADRAPFVVPQIV